MTQVDSRLEIAKNFSRIARDVAKRKKWGAGGCERIFFKVKGVFRKFLNVRGCIYKILKSGGGANLNFPI